MFMFLSCAAVSMDTKRRFANYSPHIEAKTASANIAQSHDGSQLRQRSHAEGVIEKAQTLPAVFSKGMSFFAESEHMGLTRSGDNRGSPPSICIPGSMPRCSGSRGAQLPCPSANVTSAGCWGEEPRRSSWWPTVGEWSADDGQAV